VAETFHPPRQGLTISAPQRKDKYDNTWIHNCQITDAHTGYTNLEGGAYYVLYGCTKAQLGSVPAGGFVWTIFDF
jgi:hypothetical protein